MSTIQGRYYLRAPLYVGGDPSSRDIYTFTDNDRNAQIGFSANCDLDFSQMDPVVPNLHGNGRCFLTKGKLFIKRARIVTPGADKVRAALGTLAANLLLTAYGIDADNNRQTSNNSWLLKLDNYNEWADLNSCFSNFDFKSVSDHYYFTILGQASSFLYVDDYNIQAAYKNEPLRAFLELDVDCGAGLLSTFDFSLI